MMQQSLRLIYIKEEFAELAFESDKPIRLGERCTVFMESDLLSYQQQGAQTSELVAGLSYAIAANYLNRVVGRRKIGNNARPSPIGIGPHSPRAHHHTRPRGERRIQRR